jgi:AcrR family transcriptional regulator/DNA-binding MarR family transcriptional regulator
MAAELSGESGVPVGCSFGSERYVAGLQRGRLLSATFSLVGERGYGAMTVRSVSERAGVSNRTFYECFSDREDCFLGAFNHAVDGLAVGVRLGWASELGWTARVRAALAALLQTLDREPAVRRLVFVEALAAGPRVLARRASVLEGLAGVVDQGRLNAQAPEMLAPLVAEGVVGATFGVIHARLLELRPGPLVGLLGSLMATIVLPYRGPAAAARELARPVPRTVVRRRDGDGLAWRAVSAASPIDYRLTASTQLALAAVAGRPGMNNREVSEVIGLSDQSQISRMMRRLADHGLVENAQAHTKRQARAWRLTADGEAVIDAHRPLKRAQRTTARGGKLVPAKSERRGKRRGVQVVGPAGVASASPVVGSAREGGGVVAGRVPGVPLRMTVLTHEVLAAVAQLGGRDDIAAPSNREISEIVGVKDQGQISKLLGRLHAHGLLRNTGGARAGVPNAWHLTVQGEEVLRASRQLEETNG